MANQDGLPLAAELIDAALARSGGTLSADYLADLVIREIVFLTAFAIGIAAGVIVGAARVAYPDRQTSVPGCSECMTWKTYIGKAVCGGIDGGFWASVGYAVSSYVITAKATATGVTATKRFAAAHSWEIRAAIARSASAILDINEAVDASTANECIYPDITCDGLVGPWLVNKFENGCSAAFAASGFDGIHSRRNAAAADLAGCGADALLGELSTEFLELNDFTSERNPEAPGMFTALYHYNQGNNESSWPTLEPSDTATIAASVNSFMTGVFEIRLALSCVSTA